MRGVVGHTLFILYAMVWVGECASVRIPSSRVSVFKLERVFALFARLAKINAIFFSLTLFTSAVCGEDQPMVL